MKMISIFFSAIFVSVCIADCYMHYPRGSNNRLNEQSANRDNANRCFDSQNNNRGGYNVGEMHATQGFNAYADEIEDNPKMYDFTNTEYEDNSGRVQYEEIYTAGSWMSVTSTVQHGCGNEKNNCNIVVEYTCDSHSQRDENAITQDNNNDGLRVQLRNGLNTGTPDDPNQITNVANTFNNNRNNGRAQMESEEFYAFAKQRSRNKGLFTADQNLQGNSQIYTRQNPGGTRRGLEVPEERDYFPWWNPSIWRPVFIWHNDLEECQTRMADLAQVTDGEAKCACHPDSSQNLANGNNNNKYNEIVAAETQEECEALDDAVWECHAWNMPKPECVEAGWSQVNNLGNVANSDNGGLPRRKNWQLPTISQLEDAGCYIYDESLTDSGDSAKYARLQLRMRYNMTTADYDPYNTDSNCNQDSNNRNQSPVNQNPTIDVGVHMQGLRLALNTAQTGRTFQDRSHVFRIMESNNNNDQTVKNKGARTQNLNIQGKRGNIVQTFPAVEYNFWPMTLNLDVGDCAAFQWTGSNTHNNGNPAGDGQAGDAGEGRGGSDRSNLAQMHSDRKGDSYPYPLDKMDPADDFWANSDCYDTVTGKSISSGSPNSNDLSTKDVQFIMLSGGYYQGYDNALDRDDDGDTLDVLLDNAPATQRSVTCCPKKEGTFQFMSTRNNNFSNRDQKLTIVVGGSVPIEEN